MKEKFPRFSSPEQSTLIWNALNPHVEDAGMLGSSFTMDDIFKTLPNSIEFDGHRGDLCVSTVDIAYFSIDGDWKHVLVHFEAIPIDGDVFDAFFNMIMWLKENNLM